MLSANDFFFFLLLQVIGFINFWGKRKEHTIRNLLYSFPCEVLPFGYRKGW